MVSGNNSEVFAGISEFWDFFIKPKISKLVPVFVSNPSNKCKKKQVNGTYNLISVKL